MRSLRLLVFCVALALLAGSVTTAAVRADDAGGDDPVKVDKTKKVKDDKADRPGNGDGTGNGNGKGRGSDDKPEKDKDKGDKPGKDKDKGSKGDDKVVKDGTPTEPAGDTGSAPAGVPDAAEQLPVKPGDPAAVPLPEAPVLGETLGARPSEGTIRVKLPGSNAYTTLSAADTIPMGSTIDASRGLVEIVVEAAPDGTKQNAVLTGTEFLVDQSTPTFAQPAITDFSLRGGDFRHCTDADDNDDEPVARSAKRKRTRGGVVRGLWAAAKGSFRTRGKHSAATVRGTRWATVDRCRSTTVKVFEGVVDVMDFELDRVFTVRAGERHVARERSR